jgi:23S rRNA pseudouridine2605 synthase
VTRAADAKPGPDRDRMRLQRYLAQAGVASRRKAEVLITGGHVEVNGKPATELGTKVDPERDEVRVDGTLVMRQDLVYYLLNKPKGYVSTVSDPQGRQTVMELLPRDLPSGVVPVGRLDFYTEGVLLFTNDGELSAGLLAPRSHVEKTYHVKIRGKVTPAQIDKLRAGVRLRPDSEGPRKPDTHRTLPAKVDVLKFTGTHTWLVMTIREGRSRQIHRMADAIGLQVIKLQRVAFGGITYYGVKVGESRKLDRVEVRALRRLVGLDRV